MSDRRPRLLFPCMEPPDSITAWSGTVYFFQRALAAHAEVLPIGPLERVYSPLQRFARRLPWHRLGIKLDLDRTRRVGEGLARQVERHAVLHAADAAVCAGHLPLAYARGVKKFALMDAVLPLWADYFWLEGIRYEPLGWRGGIASEQEFFRTADGVFLTSDWALEGARAQPGYDVTRAQHIPFGANLPETVEWEEVRAAIAVRLRDEIRILHVGTNWRLKGGDVAAEAVQILRARGVPAVLDVIGSAPSERWSGKEWVRHHGRLMKNDARQFAEYRALMLRSHVHLLPTMFDAFGIVFAEAAAYGVPSVGRAVNGVTTAIREGENGLTVPKDLGPNAYADAVQRILDEDYPGHCRRSHERYRDELNWGVVGRRIVEAITARL